MKNIADKRTSGIQIISEQEVNISQGTLASRTALDLITDHATALKEPFLMKKVRMQVLWNTVTPVNMFRVVIGMARGDASITAIKAALEDNLFERNLKGQAAKRDVMFETITPVTIRSFDDVTGLFDTGMISLGGGKGIPFDEEIGWKWFSFNRSAGALTTGSTMDVLGNAWGIWL